MGLFSAFRAPAKPISRNTDNRARPPATHWFQPGYFAMVMATGVVSISCYNLALVSVAYALFWLNCCLYLFFWACLILHIARSPARFFSGLGSPLEAPQYLTIDAGTCVLGAQFVILLGPTNISLILLVVGAMLWFVLTYTILSSVIPQNFKPAFPEGINGSWLLLIVSIQSLCILTSLHAPHVPPYRTFLTFFSMAFLSAGSILYLVMTPAILSRLIFLPVSAGQFTPPYWIIMGAAAITAVAAASVAGQSAIEPALPLLVLISMGLMVLFWSFASWCIPLLVLVEIVYHRRFGLPVLRYDPALWSLAFPVGMYVLGTYHAGNLLGTPWLATLAHVLLYPALIVWGLIFLGFVVTLVGRVKDIKTA